MSIKPGWKHIFTISRNYAIYRSKTHPNQFGTGFSPNHPNKELDPSPLGSEIYTIAPDLFSVISEGRSIRKNRNTLMIGCQKISLKKLEAAARKRHCWTLLISKTNQKRLAALKPNTRYHQQPNGTLAKC